MGVLAEQMIRRISVILMLRILPTKSRWKRPSTFGNRRAGHSEVVAYLAAELQDKAAMRAADTSVSFSATVRGACVIR